MKVRQIDIATRLGVSQQAVSAVLSAGGNSNIRVSEETARRIKDAARRMDYRPFRPAQQLAGRSSGVIGVLIGTHVARVHYTQLAELEQQAFAAGKQLSVGLIQDQTQVQPYLDDFQSRGIDTLICLIHELIGDNDTIPELVADFDRVIYLNRPAGVVDPAVVEIDFAQGARQSVEYLRSRGRRRIGMALISRSGRAHAMRAQGFTQAIQSDVDHPPVEHCLWLLDEQNKLSDHWTDRIDCVLDQWLLPGEFDAVIASNDEWAVHLVLGLKRRGLRVPDDVAVIGQDNTEFALACDPSLTTLDLRQTEVATELFRLATREIEEQDGDAVRCVTFNPTLIERGSA